MEWNYKALSGITDSFDLDQDTLDGLITQGFLKEQIHYFSLPSGHRRFNVPLVLDRLINLNDEAAHQRAIDHFLASLPSTQSSSRGRRVKR